MKNAVLNLAAMILLASAFVACKKEITFKDQLVGHWKSVQVLKAGEDATDTYSYDVDLQSSSEFDLEVTTIVPTGFEPVPITQRYTGDWDENDRKQDVNLRYSDGSERTWEVVAISATEMTAETLENNTRYQIKFNRQ